LVIKFGDSECDKSTKGLLMFVVKIHFSSVYAFAASLN